MSLQMTFLLQVYNNKADYKRNSFIISAVLALLGGVVTYFISGHALRPIREFSDKIEEVAGTESGRFTNRRKQSERTEPA